MLFSSFCLTSFLFVLKSKFIDSACSSGQCILLPNQLPNANRYEFSGYGDNFFGIVNVFQLGGKFGSTVDDCCSKCHADPFCQVFYYDTTQTRVNGTNVCVLDYIKQNEYTSFTETPNRSFGFRNDPSNSASKCMTFPYGKSPVDDYKQNIDVWFGETPLMIRTNATYFGLMKYYTGEYCCELCQQLPNCQQFYFDKNVRVCGLDFTPRDTSNAPYSTFSSSIGSYPYFAGYPNRAIEIPAPSPPPPLPSSEPFNYTDSYRSQWSIFPNLAPYDFFTDDPEIYVILGSPLLHETYGPSYYGSFGTSLDDCLMASDTFNQGGNSIYYYTGYPTGPVCVFIAYNQTIIDMSPNYLSVNYTFGFYLNY